MNNGFVNNNYPTGGFGGMMYQAPQQINMTQGLTEEELKSLRKNNGFSLDISEEELKRCYCTHRLNNKFTLAPDDEGYVTCTLCGTKFRPFEGTPAEVREYVNKLNDIIETVKMKSITLPSQVIRDYFQMQPLLNRLPELSGNADRDFRNATGMNDNYYYAQETNGFSMYNNIVGPSMAGGYYDPAMMNMQQPMYGAQPYGQPMAQMPQGQIYNTNPIYGQTMNGMPQQQPMYNNAQPGFYDQSMIMNNQPMYNNAQNGNPFQAQGQPQAQQQAQPQNNNTQNNSEAPANVTKKMSV